MGNKFIPREKIQSEQIRIVTPNFHAECVLPSGEFRGKMTIKFSHLMLHRYVKPSMEESPLQITFNREDIDKLLSQSLGEKVRRIEDKSYLWITPNIEIGFYFEEIQQLEYILLKIKPFFVSGN